MKNYSIWKDSRGSINSKVLDGDISCDVLIVGGGLTGISTLYHLKDSGLNVFLVDQNKIGMSVTANSTGKLTYLQDNKYNTLLSKFNFEKASLYLESQREAIDLAKKIINDNELDCDFVSSKSYVYTNKEDEMDKLEELKDFLIKNNIDVKEDNLDLVDYKRCISVSDTYLYNPVKFIYSLVSKMNDYNIYEDTSIVKIEDNEEEGYSCYTDDYKIDAKYVVIASHYPYFNLPMVFPIKGSLEKSYLCSAKKKSDNISLISYDKPFVSIRNYQDYLIYLSCSHNTCNKVDDEENFDELVEKARDVFGDADIDYAWSNIDIMTNDSLPYIGKIKDNMFIATGYNTWGMTNGILAGYLVSEMVKGNETKYDELFDPKRSSSGNIIEVAKDSYYSMMGIVKGMVKKNENVDYREINGDEVLVYKDGDKEYIVYRKCPHMKCDLLFNEVEKTWDCPCHGSRFSLDGKCISGPSNRDISYKK